MEVEEKPKPKPKPKANRNPSPNRKPKPKPKSICAICRASISSGHMSRHKRSAACKRAMSTIARSICSYEDEIIDVMNNIRTISDGVGAMVDCTKDIKTMMKLSIVFPASASRGKNTFDKQVSSE